MVKKNLLYRFPYVIYGADAPHQSSTRSTKESRSIAAYICTRYVRCSTRSSTCVPGTGTVATCAVVEGLTWGLVPRWYSEPVPDPRFSALASAVASAPTPPRRLGNLPRSAPVKTLRSSGHYLLHELCGVFASANFSVEGQHLRTTLVGCHVRGDGGVSCDG